MALGEWRKQRTPFLDSEAEEIGREGSLGDGARREFGAADRQGGASMTGQWYDTSDSEREQPGWRVPESTSRAAERALRKQRAKKANEDYTDTDTDSDTSARDTDDDSLLENMAVAARRATRAKPGYRRWRRPERGDRSRIDAAQSRWDAAMATPATPLRSCGDSPFGGDDDDEAEAVVGVTGARGKKATSGSSVAGAKRSRRAAGPSTGDASGGDFRSRLARRTVRFGDGAEREEAAAAERAERQSFPYEGARGGAAASQGLSTRRPSAHQALSGGEPGDPASVPGRKTPQGDTGTPLRDGCTFVLGCPTGETVDNQRRERRTSLSANAEAAAHGGALPTARKADGSKRELVGILKKMQIGAGERRTVSAGHGFKTTATIEVAVNDDECNDAESERRRLERAAEQPSTKRRPTPAETDDVVRRRKLALTYDRGRNVLGSRQRQRWVHQLDELGELPQGAQRAEAIKALGAQRQRAEAYAAAAAKAAPRGGGRTAPVALGSSVPEGLEAAAAAGLSLDDIIKLPSYSMARVANESDEFVIRAPFPVTNVSPADDPMPPVPDANATADDPDWRPTSLLDVYTEAGVRAIMN